MQIVNYPFRAFLFFFGSETEQWTILWNRCIRTSDFNVRKHMSCAGEETRFPCKTYLIVTPNKSNNPNCKILRQSIKYVKNRTLHMMKPGGLAFMLKKQLSGLMSLLNNS